MLNSTHPPTRTPLSCDTQSGAIYWSKISRVFYGADNDDMIRAGVNGGSGDYTQDIFHGREDTLKPQQRRRLLFTQFMRGEAAAAHEEYGKLPVGERAVYC